MKYKMYEEILQQPDALKTTLNEESLNMDEIAKIISQSDKIYLIGCGSSLSTLYSAQSALEMVTNLDIDVFTGYEFYYNKKLGDENSVAIFTSQSGETADTLISLKRANENSIKTITITNEKESSMFKEADYSIFTRGGHEEAILGTKTYTTQLACLYYILFKASKYDKANEIIEDLYKLPEIMEDLIKSTEKKMEKLGKEFSNEEIFYSMGSGPNYGLSYKLAMTMFMEGSLKHSCPLYSGEFRHGLIERVEKDVPVVFLKAGYDSDELTDKSIEFSNNLGVKSIIFDLKDYSNINKLLAPFILVVPLEWFIYYLSHYNGEDPGSTRHIGKVRY